jgi:WD40 repeat protein
VVAVWQAMTGQSLLEEEAAASALALSPGGDLLAAGSPQGRVRLWAVRPRRLLADFLACRATIHCLAFSPDSRHARGPSGAVGRLAVGDAAAGVRIWRLDDRPQLLQSCHGSDHDVYVAAFSPDGATLASAGRLRAKLWDVATGRLLLDLNGSDYFHGLAFDGAGRRLAAGLRGGDGGRSLGVWELLNGRGIQTLRGLPSSVSKCCFSADCSLLAALCHDWQVAVWELPAGRLLHTFPVGGLSADNAGLAFRADRGELAFAAGTEAHAWDLATGRQTGAWELPPGLSDSLLFPRADQLLLCRVETTDSKEVPIRRRPHVCRFRNLRLPEASKQIVAESNDYPGPVYASVAAQGERLFLVDGEARIDGQPQRTVGAFDALSGMRRWAFAYKSTDQFGTLILDHGERILAIARSSPANVLVDVATGREVGSRDPKVHGSTPDGRFLLLLGPEGPTHRGQGIALHRRGEAAPVAVLAPDSSPTVPPAFSPDGRLLAWGNSNGTVTVCDLERVNQYLQTLGLGW